MNPLSTTATTITLLLLSILLTISANPYNPRNVPNTGVPGCGAKEFGAACGLGDENYWFLAEYCNDLCFLDVIPDYIASDPSGKCQVSRTTSHNSKQFWAPWRLVG